MKQIKLSNGYTAIIDDEDLPLLGNKRWFAQFPGGKKRKTQYPYVAGSIKEEGKWRIVYLHRLITKAGKGEFVDHKNKNTLDCRRENLRICNRRQNNQNQTSRIGKSGYRGISLDGRVFRANIRDNNSVRIHLGGFYRAIDAAYAYDVMAKELHGEFASLNFPNELPEVDIKLIRERALSRVKGLDKPKGPILIDRVKYVKTFFSLSDENFNSFDFTLENGKEIGCSFDVDNGMPRNLALELVNRWNLNCQEDKFWIEA